MKEATRQKLAAHIDKTFTKAELIMIHIDLLEDLGFEDE